MARSDGSSKARKPRATSTRVSKRQSAAPAISGSAAVIDRGERHRMIAEAAYYRAQQRGFCGGDPVQDWLEAEAEVAVRLSSDRGFHVPAGIENGFEVGNVPKGL